MANRTVRRVKLEDGESARIVKDGFGTYTLQISSGKSYMTLHRGLTYANGLAMLEQMRVRAERKRKRGF